VRSSIKCELSFWLFLPNKVIDWQAYDGLANNIRFSLIQPTLSFKAVASRIVFVMFARGLHSAKLHVAQMSLFI
jgi:hypothetical protein